MRLFSTNSFHNQLVDQWIRMYNEDRYFLVLAPNWVGTRVLLRLSTNGSGTVFFLVFLLDFFFDKASF